MTLSLAGRTSTPLAQAGELRVGGFGGAEGLAGFLREAGVDLVIDATHPFAARISANAVAAARMAGVPLIVLDRPAWARRQGDRWIEVARMTEAAVALGEAPRRVFLAIGRQEVAAFRAAPQHRYLVRSVEPVAPEDAPVQAEYILSRGPFAESDENALLREHGIDVLVAKNSGGAATYGKIEAARALGLPVVMVARPAHAGGMRVESPEAVLSLLDHGPAVATLRGE